MADPAHGNSNLDIAILRTLLAIEQHGSMTHAATTVGRSESAISLQIKRLEDQLGQRLYRRVGHKLVPTAACQIMLKYARRLIDLNNEALIAATAPQYTSVIRLGVVPDYSTTWLPMALALFNRLHPDVNLEVLVERGLSLISRLNAGDLDLVVAFEIADQIKPSWSGTVPMIWIGPPSYRRSARELVSLVVFDPPCSFRSAATSALDTAGIRWNIEFVSPTLPSLWGAVTAGMGITVRSPVGMPPQLANLCDAADLPRLPAVRLALYTRIGILPPAISACQDVLIETMRGSLNAAI